MKQVRIAELEAKLSGFLRFVRRGESIAVLDRGTAVAQIVPIRERPGVRIRRPALGLRAPNRVALPKPAQLGTLDAIHLASAQLWKDATAVDPVMATHDGALGFAAQFLDRRLQCRRIGNSNHPSVPPDSRNRPCGEPEPAG